MLGTNSLVRRHLVEFTGVIIEQLLDIQGIGWASGFVRLEMWFAKLHQPWMSVRRGKVLLGHSVAPFVRLDDVLSGLRPGFYYGLAGGSAPR